MIPAASVTNTPPPAMIQGKLWKNAPPSDPVGETTTVIALAPNGTTSDAWRPLIGNCFSLLTMTSLARRECPR